MFPVLSIKTEFHAWGRKQHSVKWLLASFFSGTDVFMTFLSGSHRKHSNSICIKQSFPLINHNVMTRFRISICCSCCRTENCISRFTESIWVSTADFVFLFTFILLLLSWNSIKVVLIPDRAVLDRYVSILIIRMRNIPNWNRAQLLMKLKHSRLDNITFHLTPVIPH